MRVCWQIDYRGRKRVNYHDRSHRSAAVINDIKIAVHIRFSGLLQRVLQTVLSIVIVGTPGTVTAQEQPGGKEWIGTRVVPKRDDFKLSTEDGLVDPEWNETYRVERVDGPRLWLKVDGRGISGWAGADEVVLVEEATAFFDRLIRANPRDPHGYSMHGMIAQNEKQDFEAALHDFNELVRLEPTKAYAYHLRGILWCDLKDYDKAIADFDKAAQLDPKDALNYNSRGIAWFSKVAPGFCRHARMRNFAMAGRLLWRQPRLVNCPSGMIRNISTRLPQHVPRQMTSLLPSNGNSEPSSF